MEKKISLKNLLDTTKSQEKKLYSHENFVAKYYINEATPNFSENDENL